MAHKTNDQVLQILRSTSIKDWLELVVGSAFFDRLCELAAGGPDQKAALDKFRTALESLGEFADNWSLDLPDLRHYWTMARLLVICAQTAAINPLAPDEFTRLPPLLADLGLQLTANPLQALASALDAGQARDTHSWQASIHEHLAAVNWRKLVPAYNLQNAIWSTPIGTAWAWDVLCRFWGRPRHVERAEHITVLLAVGGQGITATLVLEWLPDGGNGSFYPDPPTMSFMAFDRDYHTAMDNSVAWVREELEWWPAASGCDVRWRLEFHESQSTLLHHIHGGSAGAAYALALAKLALPV